MPPFEWLKTYIDELIANPWNTFKVPVEFLSRYMPLALIISTLVGFFAFILYINTRDLIVTGFGIIIMGLALGVQNIIPEIQFLGIIFLIIGAGMSVYEGLQKR